MLSLEQTQRDEVLLAFQNVIRELNDKRDDLIIDGLLLVRQCKIAEADSKLAEIASIDERLTNIRSYLESEYKQVVSLH